SSEGWYVKGKAYLGMGQFDKAIVCLERAHRLNPDFLQAKRALDVLRKKLVEGPGEKEKVAAKKKTVTQSEKAKNEKSVQTEIMHPETEADIVSDEFKRPEELLTKDESTVLGLITDEPVTAAKLRAAIGSTLSKTAVDRALEGLERKVLVRAEKEGKTKKYSRTQALGSLTEEIIEKKEETEHLDSSGDIHALISRAKKYIDGGRSKEAAEILKKALKINPYDDMAVCLMSQAQYDMGDRDRAINTISRILSRRPDYIPAWFTLANATLKSGEYSDAAECFRKILELQPDNAEARKGLSAAEKGLEKS
ncbi:MAG: tetratricopeptide repeat protein, partial [Thermoplasmata archaeon]|nr:tetratricopeptide repeat protein [Thermoplasmata archaeon]